MAEEEEEGTIRYHCAEIENIPDEIKEAISYYCCKMAELTQEPKPDVGVRRYTLPEDTEEEGEGSSDMPGPSTTTGEENPSMKGRKSKAKDGGNDEVSYP